MSQQPTAQEQLFLELTNRARIDPAGEFDALITNAGSRTGVTDDITGALRYFDVDMNLLERQLSQYDSVAPLAWSTGLAQSADNHNALMIQYDQQSHFLPGEPSITNRILEGGYASPQTYLRAAENVFAYTEDPVHGHAGFFIDWGFGPGGLQSPAGHREAILSTRYEEIGIGMVRETDGSTSVGPYVVTQHFANRSDYQAQLLGVVIDDRDGDDFYDIGEGMGGVTVTATSGGDEYVTTTWDAGGYQLVLPDGVYTVVFSGGGLDGEVTTRVTMQGENVKFDARADEAQEPAPVPGELRMGTAESDAISGTLGDDTIQGNFGFDTISGGEGRDRLSGENGFDVIRGGAGHDTLLGNSGNDSLYGDQGDDLLQGGIGFDLLNGGGGGDMIYGRDGFDTLQGGAGNDTMQGNFGNDSLEGGAGNDMLLGGLGSDTITGGDGADTLQGANGFDQLFGGAGADVLEGNAGNDRLDGGADDDILRGGMGADTFVFTLGSGDDTVIDFQNRIDRIWLDSSLFSQNQPVADDLRALSSLDANGHLFIDFGGGDSLTFNNIGNTGTIIDEVVFF